MRLIRNLGWMLVLATGFSACFEAPEFPDEPEISYNKIEFTDLANASMADTLILTINFKDGDGDLGLGSEGGDLLFPYNDKFYFKSTTGERFPNDFTRVEDVPIEDWIHYYSIQENPELDTLPPFVAPYTCTNWEVVLANQEPFVPIDTLYFQLNPDQYNIFVEFYTQQPDQSFKLFNWNEEFPTSCTVNGFNGRFPILSKDLSQQAAQEGKLRYAMPSVGWNIIFSIKVLKLKVWIQDRALHKSNVVETPPFQLQAI